MKHGSNTEGGGSLYRVLSPKVVRASPPPEFMPCSAPSRLCVSIFRKTASRKGAKAQRRRENCGQHTSSLGFPLRLGATIPSGFEDRKIKTSIFLSTHILV